MKNNFSHKKYSEDFKKIIVTLYQNGKTQAKLIKEYGISQSAIFDWIKKYSEVKVFKLRFQHNIKLLCKVLKVNRSTYYKHFFSKPSFRTDENLQLKTLGIDRLFDAKSKRKKLQSKRLAVLIVIINIFSLNRVYLLDYSPTGFDKLISNLSSWAKDETIFGLESTAHYGNNLIKFLLAHNFKVALINTLQTSYLRKANIRNTKK